MGNILEINGVIIGNNGDVTLSESKLEDVLINLGCDIKGDDGIIDSTLVIEQALKFGFVVISLYYDSDDYHFVMTNEEMLDLERYNPRMYDAINQIIDDYEIK